MSSSDDVWEPTLRSRLTLLRSELDHQGSERVEVPVPGLTVDAHLGLESTGALWMRITCDPKSVSPNDTSASIRLALTPTGYKISVASSAAETVAIHFLDEVIELLEAGHPPGDAGRAALQNWRDLLARPPGAPLSEKALIGLFGELEVLEMLLQNGGQLGHWTGWHKDHCDFRLPGLAIEVKSTESANYRRVQIHGLQQLADPEDGSRLLLVLRRLEASPDGRSVPRLTDDIVRLGASRSELLDRLSHMGYSEQHRPEHELRRFVSQELVVREVTDGHPRLTPQLLAQVDLSSIDKIDYELNLNADTEGDLPDDLASLLREHMEAS